MYICYYMYKNTVLKYILQWVTMKWQNDLGPNSFKIWPVKRHSFSKSGLMTEVKPTNDRLIWKAKPKEINGQ